MRANRSVFDDLRRLLDPRDVAEAEGLRRRGRDFDCPACAGHLEARSASPRALPFVSVPLVK